MPGRTVPQHECPGQPPCPVCDTPAFELHIASEIDVMFARKPPFLLTLAGNSPAEIQEAFETARTTLGWTGR